MARIAVIGAGIGGLGVALCAGRAGHQVVLVERDDTPLPADPHGAFEWDRRGAPQVRHSHAFLARLRNLLRDRHPDVLEQLFAAGATPMDFISMLPEGMDRSPLPGDEDLVALACRRTTFEWVLRRVVTEGVGDKAPIAELRHGRTVTALGADGDSAAVTPQLSQAGGRRTGAPTVTGIELDDGSVIDADVVVDASGRRSSLPSLLDRLGVELPDTVEDTGIVYFSRFFALRDDAELPAQLGPIGGDLGYLKYGVFPGDDRTFSITLATRSGDDELRRRLLDPEGFVAAAGQIPATAAHVEPGRSRAITEVHVMAGLLNRRRRFLDDDGAPRVLGLHAVGDAHTCTNPLYGRGCSLAMVQAQLFADSLQEHGTDHLGRALAFEASSATEITPWYRAAVAQDRMGRESPGSSSGADAPVDPRDFARQLLRDGLFPALRVDPVVLRAFLAMFNLLRPPDSLMRDGEVISRVMAVYADRAARPPEPPAGPDRAELLALLDAP